MSDKSHLKRGLALPHVILPATTGAAICLAVAPGLHVLIVYPWTGRPGLPNPPHWDDIPGAPPVVKLGKARALDMRPSASLRMGNGMLSPRGHLALIVARLPAKAEQVDIAARKFRSEVAKAFELRRGGEKYLKRLTLLVSAGTIEAVRYPGADPALHASEVLGWLEHEAAAGT
jgi:hypothetical protein